MSYSSPNPIKLRRTSVQWAIVDSTENPPKCRRISQRRKSVCPPEWVKRVSKRRFSERITTANRKLKLASLRSHDISALPHPNTRSASPHPNTRSASPRPNARSASPRPNARSASPRPNTRSVSPRPNARSASPRPNARSASPRPNARSASPRPNARLASPRPNARSASPRLNARSASPRPNVRSASPRLNAISTSPLPNARSKSPRPKPRPPVLYPRPRIFELDGHPTHSNIETTVMDADTTMPVDLPLDTIMQAFDPQLFDIISEQLPEPQCQTCTQTQPDAGSVIHLFELKDYQELNLRYTAFCSLKSAVHFDQAAAVKLGTFPHIKDGFKILSLQRQLMGRNLQALHAQWKRARPNSAQSYIVDQIAEAVEAGGWLKGVKTPLTRSWWQRLGKEAIVQVEQMAIDEDVIDLTTDDDADTVVDVAKDGLLGLDQPVYPMADPPNHSD